MFTITAIIRKMIPKKILYIRKLLQHTRPFAERRCPICGYEGFFGSFGNPLRIDARCPSCESLERHRLLWLWISSHENLMIPTILHFGPEACIERRLRKRFPDRQYLTADLNNPKTDLHVNIESIDLVDNSINTVICNHVLEHVDDRKALNEIYRILSPHGVFIVSVPIIETWNTTYENPAITTKKDRLLHFGQEDHVRYYGKDFRNRLNEAGFQYEEVVAEGSNVISFGLIRGEVLFICKKTNSNH